ncbi:MAG: hypothetical protein R2862_00965 [Thermoanaerobaculia bacterium]
MKLVAAVRARAQPARARYLHRHARRGRRAALAHAELFALPTRGENFGIAVAEALAARRAGGDDDRRAVGEPRAARLRLVGGAGGRSCHARSPAGSRSAGSRASANGENGRELVRDELSWEAIAGQSIEVYRWLLSGGAPPKCVQICARITVVTGPWLPCRPCAAARCKGVGQAGDRDGESRTRGHDRRPELPRPAAGGDDRRRPLPADAGILQSGHLTLDLVKDFAYAVNLLPRLPPADILVTNDFWLPALAARFRRKAGAVVVSAGRFPRVSTVSTAGLPGSWRSRGR